jgi:membrane protease YdiL (CAAX protease family)
LLYGTAFRTLSTYAAWFRIPSGCALTAMALIGTFILVLWFALVHYHLIGPYHFAKVRHLLETPTAVIAILFGAAIEEIVFRGFLLTEARRAFGPLAAIVLSSLIFWAFHLPIWHGQFAIPYRAITFQSISLIAFASIYGAMAIKTRSLLLPIVAHSVQNLLLLR